MNARYNAGRGRVLWERDHSILALLVTAAYEFSAAHRTLDAVDHRIGSPIEVSGRSIDGDGYAIAAPLRFPKVPRNERDAAGVVIYRKTGKDTTLIAYYSDIDTFPIPTNGGDIDVAWPEDKLFRL